MSLTSYQQNVLSYAVNRDTRWRLEEVQAPTITEAAAAHISAMLPEEKPTTTSRLDKAFFAKHNPKDPLNRWVKGCPDMLLQCGQRNFHIELKIKTDAFRKTVEGGVTKSGAPIAAYGCVSFYLDDYVLAQQNAFCAQTGLDPAQFLILFTTPNATVHNMHIVTLAAVNHMVAHGWEGHQIVEYGEGYGSKAHLLPKDAMIPLGQASRDQLDAWSTAAPVLPA